ncbi:uncharacterized protein [Pagrus major]|uniref:uncharacterized protein n=1 Tax=Pagrus major TaxID=143350 RepID=UPI003CC894E2
MSSVECLRGFINQRLTAAAEEIFGVFQKTVVEYEEEIDRQRKLLDIVLKPEIKLDRIELPQQHVCTEDEVLADQLLCDQERNSSLDQEDPEPPQIKEEQEELCSSQEGEQLVLKQETDTFMLNTPYEESDHREPEPKSDHQLLSHNSHVAESQDQKGGKRRNSGSTRAAKSKKRHNAHNSEKPFKCDTCGKDFKLKSDLNAHLKVHTGEKPYLCNTCGKRFRIRKSLILHMSVHTGEKPFPSKTCGEDFKTSSNLLIHMRVHTGEKPYLCKTCGKRFCWSSQMKSHIQIHEGEHLFTSSLDQEDPEPPQITEEQEELCSSQEGEQLVLKQETDTFMLNTPYEESDHREPEPKSDHQLLSHNSHVAESQYQKRGKHRDSGSTRAAEPEPKKRHNAHKVVRPLKCDTCGKDFKYKSQFYLHLRVHTGEKPYLCNTCGTRFSQRSSLNSHIRLHTGEKPYSCNTCGKTFSRKTELNSHIRLHTGEKPFSCLICGRDFRCSSNMLVHMRIHMREKPMSSVECLRGFISERLTAAAEEIFGVFKKTIVEYEEEIDRQRKLLDIVWKPKIKLHRIELPQQQVCTEDEVLADQLLCDQDRSSSLDQEDPEPPQIKEEEQEELCSSQEGEQLVLKQETDTFMLIPPYEESDHSEPKSDHQLLSHNSHVAESQDQKGGKRRDSGSTRAAEPKPKKRLNAHNSEKPFKCETCGIVFKYKSQFYLHLRVHTGEKPFPCNTCGKSFRMRKSLNAHIRIHTGERPFPCNTCGRDFRSSGKLWEHMRTHTGEKPYSCDTCGKLFGRSNHLVVHMRIHTGEKPYPCKTCGKGYRHLRQLKKHIKIHEGEELITCWLLNFLNMDTKGGHIKLERAHRSLVPKPGSDQQPHPVIIRFHARQANEMSSVECLRGFINERLTAAAEEIFGVFKKTVVEYEEEIDRQRKLLDIVWKPEIKLHRIELPQQHVCTEDEVLADQLLCDQDRNSSLDQEDPEPPQIKEEQEELCSSQEGEQLVLKQETDTFMLIPLYEQSDHSEPKSDHQLLSHNSHVAESQDQKGGKQRDSGSTRAAEPEPKKRHNAHKGEKPFKCDTCGRDFKLKSDLNAHLTIHTGEKPFSCNTCGKRFRIRKSIILHNRVHTGEKPFPCKTCGKDFRSSSNLLSHMRVHTGEKPTPYLCKTCGMRFCWSSQLKSHIKIHEGKNLFNSSLAQQDPEPPQITEEQEELCSSQEGEQLVLKQETDTFMLNTPFEESDHREPEPKSDHQLLSHNSHVAESQDQKGGKHRDSGSTRAAEPELPKRHNVHKGEKPFKCDTCGKDFKYKYDFNLHLRVHTGEKPYLCNTCGKRFSQRSSLTCHTQVHTGEKPFSCNTCGKSFRQNSSLNCHKRLHTGEKPFSCKTCGRDFRTTSNLLAHMRIHTGEKPYLCNTCGKAFKHRYILLDHRRVHTGEKPYVCKTCGMKFSWMSQMKRHKRIHEGENITVTDCLSSNPCPSTTCSYSKREEKTFSGIPDHSIQSGQRTKMSSVECLRGFINERLTAAAEEIFGVFQKTIVEYEEEIDRQRKLLDIVWKPNMKLHKIELPQQQVCTEDEVLADQLLCDQERNSSLDQEDPEPPQIKEEQEELCSSQEGEQLVLKQETDTFMLNTPFEESDHREPEPKSDHQLLSHNSHVAESQDQKGGKHRDSGSTRAAEPEPKKRHKRHKVEKPYRCDTCGKNFKFKSKLYAHLRIHTGEKPYLCNTCGRRFRQRSALNAHIRIHTGEKPFSCDTCGKDFTRASNLSVHMRVHTGEKPYLCKTCGKRFCWISQIKKHGRIHEGENLLTCKNMKRKKNASNVSVSQ